MQHKYLYYVGVVFVPGLGVSDLTLNIIITDVEGIYLFTSGIPDQPNEALCSYIEEKAAGRELKNHVVLFNVDDYDAGGAIPSRYANITITAECLRNLAHCCGGRFHWFRETGVYICLHSTKTNTLRYHPSPPTKVKYVY